MYVFIFNCAYFRNKATRATESKKRQRETSLSYKLQATSRVTSFEIYNFLFWAFLRRRI